MSTTTQNIILTAPDGVDVEVEVVIEWDYDHNPCDKDKAHYTGEDDGWNPITVEVT